MLELFLGYTLLVATLVSSYRSCWFVVCCCLIKTIIIWGRCGYSCDNGIFFIFNWCRCFYSLCRIIRFYEEKKKMLCPWPSSVILIRLCRQWMRFLRPYMSSTDETFIYWWDSSIHGWHPWMRNVHPFMELSSVTFCSHRLPIFAKIPPKLCKTSATSDK